MVSYRHHVCLSTETGPTHMQQTLSVLASAKLLYLIAEHKANGCKGRNAVSVQPKLGCVPAALAIIQRNAPSKKFDFPDPLRPTAEQISKSAYSRFRPRRYLGHQRSCSIANLGAMECCARTEDVVVGAQRNLDLLVAFEARNLDGLDMHFLPIHNLTTNRASISEM